MCTDIQETIGWTANSSVWQENKKVESVKNKKGFQAYVRAIGCKRGKSIRAMSIVLCGVSLSTQRKAGGDEMRMERRWLRPRRVQVPV